MLPPAIHLLQEGLPSAPPGAGPSVQFVWYVIVFIFFVVGGLIILLTRRKERVEVISDKKAAGLEGLLKVREEEMAQITKEHTKLAEDFRDVESELKVATGIKMQELFEFWAKKEAIEAENESQRSKIRSLENTLARWERGEMMSGHSGSQSSPEGRP
jgi:hypothetical protein